MVRFSLTEEDFRKTFYNSKQISGETASLRVYFDIF